MLRGNQLTPREAKEIGLLTDIFTKKEFKKKVQAVRRPHEQKAARGIDAIKKSVLQGMSTTLRHGLSLELNQSLRCLETKDTVMAMDEYIRYINENIMTIDPDRATTKDVTIVRQTLDVMENARLFKAFEGK